VLDRGSKEGQVYDWLVHVARYYKMRKVSSGMLREFIRRRRSPKSGIGGESGTDDQQSFALVYVTKPDGLFE